MLHRLWNRMITIYNINNANFAVTFPYNADNFKDLLLKIKRVSGRKWMPENKRWEVPLVSIELFAEIFKGESVIGLKSPLTGIYP